MKDSRAQLIINNLREVLLVLALFIIGLIMFVGGFVILTIGLKRRVKNALLWALFPIIHGLHEFVDYAIDDLGQPESLERYAAFLAVTSSFILLAAAIEFLGASPSPYGKIAGGSGILLFGYIIFMVDETTLEVLGTGNLDFGLLHSDIIRFLHGFVLVEASALAILLSYMVLRRKASRKILSLDRQLLRTVLLSIGTLVFFSAFEGFNSDDPTFILMRAISLFFFLIIPAIAIYFTKPGLQTLLVVNGQSGELLFGYNFYTYASFGEIGIGPQLENHWINTASFLSALATFANFDQKIGKLSQMNTDRANFALASKDQVIAALDSRSYTRGLRKSLAEFVEKITPLLESAIKQPTGKVPPVNPDDIKPLLRESFEIYY